jgi:hypothetical protein
MSCAKSQHAQSSSRFDLVSLMELLKYNAEACCRLCGLVGQMVIVLNNSSDFPDTIVEPLGSTLGELMLEAEKLQLRSAMQQLVRIKGMIDARDVNTRSMATLMIEVQNRLVDDLSARLFLAVPSRQEHFYKQEQPLFGDDVENKFGQMSEDIAEAGKCISMNRNTAAVFHLMRVMEIGVQRFGDKLGVTLVQEKVWQVILDQTNAAIRKMDPKQPKTKAYAEAASHLYNVKVAWRNEVMHPKQTYTDEEAMAIFGNVRTFIIETGLI